MLKVVFGGEEKHEWPQNSDLVDDVDGFIFFISAIWIENSQERFFRGALLLDGSESMVSGL